MTAWKTQAGAKEIRIVLIVSQDLKMVAAWDLIFKQKDCYVIHEKSPRHALQSAYLLSPSLVIVDLNLTQSARLDLCKELRPAISGTLLLLAPKTNEDEISEYYRAGVDERLSPTISPMALLSKSLAWLAHQELAAPREQLTRVYA